MPLSPVHEKFILHWGEMGTRWGINRTVAQVHALLYIMGKPLHAEEITETLGVARSNVSTSLKELQGWGIVKITHVMNDRRDHFETTADVWTLFQQIMDERKRREIDPTVAVLRECVADAKASGDKEAEKRLRELSDFVETMTGWYTQVRRLPLAGFKQVMKMGSSLQRFLPK